jgi:hypothetical protein
MVMNLSPKLGTPKYMISHVTTYKTDEMRVMRMPTAKASGAQLVEGFHPDFVSLQNRILYFPALAPSLLTFASLTRSSDGITQ